MESEKITQGFLREYILIAGQATKIIANPKVELKDTFVLMKGLFVYFGLMFLLMLSILIVNRDIMSAVLLGFIIGLFYYSIITNIRYVIFQKQTRSILENTPLLQYDIEGAFVRSEMHMQKSYWSAIQCIRVYKHSFVLVPKSASGSVLVSTLDELEPLIAFMKENEIHTTLIRSAKS